MRRAVTVWVLGILAELAAPLGAQAQASLDFKQNYPFHQARAVVADTSGPGVTLYEGAGAGIFVLEEAGLDLSLKPGVANQLRAGGFVRDLTLTDDHLYVAAHRAGMRRFELGTSDDSPDTFLDAITNAWAVDVPARISGIDIVFVGTNDDFYDYGPSGGRLHLVHADVDPPIDAPQLIATVDLHAPVYAIDSIVHNDVITLLVGTACREENGVPSSLLRYDIDISGNTIPFTIPAPSAQWSPDPHGIPMTSFIQDVVIDPDPTALAAYVADYSRGVFKVDLTQDLPLVPGLKTAPGQYPIKAVSGNNVTYYWSLALAADSPGLNDLLVVGLAPDSKVERTVWGDCSTPSPCDGSSGAASHTGVGIYDVGGMDPVPVGSLINGSGQDQNHVFDLVSYPRSGRLVVAAAALQDGLVMLEHDPITGGRLEKGGQWNTADGVPVGQFDDLILLGDNIFVASENSLVGFDVTNGLATDLFDEPVDIANGGAVVLAGVEAENGFPTTVFGSALMGGVFLYEVQGSGPTAQILQRGSIVPTMDPRTDEVRTYSVAALPPSETPDGYPWLIAINARDGFTKCDGAQNGSVWVYRVMLNTEGEIDADALCLLGAFAPSACDFNTGRLIGGQAIGDATGARVVVAYSPRPSSAAPGDEPDAGLLFLRFEFREGLPGDPMDDSVTLDWQSDPSAANKVVAFPNAFEEESALLRFDGHHSLLAAAFGCNGVATYSLAAETLISRFPAGGPGAPSAFMDVLQGPNGNLYCTTIDGRLWAFDPLSMDNPLLMSETQGQAAFLEPAPTSLGGSPPPPAFYLTDFRTGIHRVEYTDTP